MFLFSRICVLVFFFIVRSLLLYSDSLQQQLLFLLLQLHSLAKMDAQVLAGFRVENSVIVGLLQFPRNEMLLL